MTDQHRNHGIGETFNARNQELQSARRRSIIGIASSRIAGGGGPGREPIALDEGAELPIRLGDVLFAFTKGAVGHSPLIAAAWGRKIRFVEATVYIRTRDALYRVHHDALKAFKELLPDPFQQVSRSVLANLAHVQQLRLRGSVNHSHTLTCVVENNALSSSWGFEHLKVGREYLFAVRARYGYPRVASEQSPRDGALPSASTVRPVGSGVLSQLLFHGKRAQEHRAF